MANKSFQVINPTALTDFLNDLEEAVGESTLRQAAVAGARVLQEEIKLRAPIGPHTHVRSGTSYPPGTLRNNILIAHDKENSVANKLQTYMVFIGPDAFYGHIVEIGRRVEFGSSREGAHPFIRPAFDAKKSAAGDAVRKVIEQKIQEAMRGK